MPIDIPKELNFNTEDERIQLIEKYEAEGGKDPNEVDRIMNAPVANPDPEPVDPDLEPDTSAAPDANAAPAAQAPAAAQPNLMPAQAPAQAPAGDSGHANRNWVIREEEIPKDTFFDKKENRVRPFITHKTPQDLIKSYISAQKRIHYLEDVLGPQERQAIADQTRTQYENELARLKAENERLARSVSTPALATPGHIPGAVQQAAPSAATIADSTNALGAALAELKAVQSDDAFNHTDKMHKALVAALDQINVMSSHMKTVEQTSQQAVGKMTEFEANQQRMSQETAAQAKQREAEENWSRACGMVDSFATTNKDFVQEYGRIDQSFKDMSKEAMQFHMMLAGVKFNKHPNTVTDQETIAASQSYLGGDTNLIQAAQQYGIDEPRHYKAWVELDQVDAMRTGLYRDPVSKQWQQIADPVTRKPVHLGDMETAYGRFLDVTGKRNQRVQALLNQERQGITGAVSRRDSGVVSMDTNHLRSDGTGSDLTEQQAGEILETTDPSLAVSAYLQTGNQDQLQLINRAMIRLGMQPLEIPDRQARAQARK